MNNSRHLSAPLAEMIASGSDIGLEEALNATNSLQLRVLAKPNVVHLPRGPVSPFDLPLDPLPQDIFDLVGIINFDRGHECMQRRAVSLSS